MVDTATIASPVVSAASPVTSTTKPANTRLADNFQTFLTLLTTQLKNQNPLDPLDTNQITAQLVQCAQVEQQIKQNDQLSTLISLEKTAQSMTALAFVGATVAIDVQTAALSNGKAAWSFTAPKPVSATVTIRNAAGQTVYSTNLSMNAGAQNFVWDGRDASGTKWPDGNYTISIAAKDASGQPAAVSTEVEGVVDSVDLTKSPPELSIGGSIFTIDKIKRVVRPK